jgi:signal transduction histidine kinase/phage shock protein PspC (stress-responsive transcriptional regulator)
MTGVSAIMDGRPMATTSRPRFPGLPADLTRRPDERVVAGVCAGVAGWLGVDPLVVRLAAVILTLANGVGVLAYLIAWVVLPEAPPAPAAPVRTAAGRAPTAAPDGARAGRRSAETALAVGCITLGVLVLVRWSAPFFPDVLVWPGVLAAVGIGLVLARGGDGPGTLDDPALPVDRDQPVPPAGAARGDARRDAWARLVANPLEVLSSGRWFWLRLFGGGLLLVLGIGLFLAANQAFESVSQVGIAVLATAIGVALVFGPWMVRLVTELRDERRERIRSEERADMAAHLHDSVLQTLAMIQRTSDASTEARGLARRQERELRAWLYDGRRRRGHAGGDGATPADGDGAGPGTLAAALDRLTDEVEADHPGFEVDVVLVGDGPLDPRVAALVRAVREAVVNAANHSGEPTVSVYAEVTAGQVEAFVRDRGRGFDPGAVGPDRQGIAHSIVGRMDRHGGHARVHSAPGEGTEVHVRVARARTPEEIG